MSDALVHVYHRLPGPARQAAASAVGWYLGRWRYGPETDQLVSEALEREQWSSDRWKAYREERLSFVLHRAVKHVPFYRDHWTKRRMEGDRSSWDVLSNWPILEKDSLRANPHAFVADDCNPRKMFSLHTSGTTGKALQLWRSQATTREWYALNEARSRRWYGISRKDRWAIIGGRLVTPVGQKRPPFWVWNSGLRQLYMSAYHLSADLVPSYLDALVRYNITYVFGYSSGLYALAEAALRLKRKDLRLAVAISNAEPLLDYQRHAIETAFRCPVRETYGSAEIVAGASECERGSLHAWPEVGVMEVVDGTQEVRLGQLGDLVSTGLMNADMPLIRYRTGDAIRLSTAVCHCRRELPVIHAIEGRCDDLVVLSDGRKIGRLDPVFKEGSGVSEAQIVQESLTRFRLRYVPAEQPSADLEDRIRKELQLRLGSVDVIFESVSQIPRTERGKFRAVISHLAAEDRRAVS